MSTATMNANKTATGSNTRKMVTLAMLATIAYVVMYFLRIPIWSFLKYDPKDIILGAGTVMDAATARIAMLSGAQYIVSPYLDLETLKMCNRYRVAMMPGVMTVREAVMAMENGAEILKVFPGDLFGPKIIKDIRGPIPYAKMMPTGGVNADNVGEWIKAGAVAVGAGSSLTAGAKTGDYKQITETAKKFVANIKAARAEL